MSRLFATHYITHAILLFDYAIVYLRLFTWLMLRLCR